MIQVRACIAGSGSGARSLGRMRRAWQRFLAAALICSTSALGMPMPAFAALIGTEQIASAQNIVRPARARIAALLDRAEVQAELQRLGVSPDAARQRIAAMTDDEVDRLAGRLPELPAGGEIIGVLLTVFIVLLVTDILGFTKVFSFTRPIKK